MKKAIELVMFDLDGTLADTGKDLADAVNFTRAHFDLPPWPAAEVLTLVGWGVEYLLQHALPERSPLHCEEALRVFIHRYENHLLDTTVLYPNVREALQIYRKKRRAVVSNKMHRLTLAVLRGLGIEDCFDAILGGDSAPRKKPDPALLQQVVARYGVAAHSAIMVGDGEIDIQAGKQAGVLTCGVTYGFGDREGIVAAKPDFIIDDLSELARHVR